MKVSALILVVFAFVATSHAVKSPVCDLQHSLDGNGVVACLVAFNNPFWSYNSATNECVTFHYGGCGGNDNRFGSREDCETMCKD